MDWYCDYPIVATNVRCCKVTSKLLTRSTDTALAAFNTLKWNKCKIKLVRDSLTDRPADPHFDF